MLKVWKAPALQLQFSKNKNENQTPRLGIESKNIKESAPPPPPPKKKSYD